MSNKLHEYYEEAIKDMPQASKRTRDTFEKLEIDFNEYIYSLQETAFWHGYMTRIKDEEENIETKKALLGDLHADMEQ